MMSATSSQPVSSEVVSDKGASALLIALSMVMLMGLAAIAVDGGIAFDERRQQQSAADTGALAAAQFADKNLPTSNATCATLTGTNYAACRGAEEAIAVVEGTLPGTYSLSGWQACSDPARPAEFTRISALSPCISFTASFQEARVVLPGVDIDTTFGAIIGLNSIPVGAFAQVGVDLDQSADVLPWAIGPSGSNSNYTCLFANSSSNLNVDPCNGPTQGNFGKLDVSLYGNGTMKTPQICGNAQTQTKMAVNIITGADHLLEEETKNTPGTVNDWANCPGPIKTGVDELAVQTGNAESGIKDGMFLGTSATTKAYEGRLLCKTGEADEYSSKGNEKVSTGSCVTVGNQFTEQVDHTPLWTFLESPITELPNPGTDCGNGGDPVDTWPEMKDCLQAWKDYSGSHNDSLFTNDLRFSPRFAAVPILNNDPSNGSGNYLITEFRPVYIDTFYLKCNATSCDIVHSPGYPNSPANCPNPLTTLNRSCGWGSNGNKQVTAVTSYMLTVDMLPDSIRDTFPNTVGTVVYNLTR